MHLVRRSAVAAAVMLVALAASSCKKDYYTGPTGAIDPATEDFAKNLRDLGVDLSTMTKTTTGIYYRDKTVGTGTNVVAGDSIAVTYTGYLTDGRIFDSNQGGSPFPLRIGVGRVIKGWDQAIPGMRVGSIRLLVIPSALGYADRGQGSIPPFANLVFQVQVNTRY
jgi:FKBP-type peptidyl-prolyl cis-trans isomerase FkpA